MNNEKKMRSNYNTIFLEETSSLNPYGPNYYYLAYDTKVLNKFNRMKMFTQISKEDTERILWGNIYHFSGMIFSLLFGVGIGFFSQTMISKVSPRLHEKIKFYPRTYYGFFSFPMIALGYSAMNDYYIRNVCIYLMDKYIDEAKKNGFEDYELDETHKYKNLIIYIKKILNIPYKY